MSFARAFLPLLLLAAGFVEVPTARAQELIPPRVIIRRFPQGTFCALPVSITFTAPATPVTITFSAKQWISDGSQLQWTDQAIDNVSVALSSVVAANIAGPFGTCYDQNLVTYFGFDLPGATSTFLDLFDTDPAPRGWTGSALTSFVAGGRTALRNPDHDDQTSDDISGGCLRLGDGSDVPDANATQTATITLSNLTEGQSYDLGAWWDCNFVPNGQDQVFLTITVTTGTTPIATKSWGAVKHTYR
jgi:hypothetical protein